MLRYLHTPIVAAAVSLAACCMCACIPNTHTYSDDYSDYDYNDSSEYEEAATVEETPVAEVMIEENNEFYEYVSTANEIMSQLESRVYYDNFSDWDELVERFNSTYELARQYYDSSDSNQYVAMSRLDSRIDSLNEAFANAQAETEAVTDSVEVYY